MRARITQVAAMLLIAVVASPLMAAPDKKKDKKGHKAHDPSAKILKNVQLTDAQKEQIKKITAEHQGAIKGAKVGLTADQKKARAEAIKKAKAEGKKGKELKAAADAAAALSDEQKEALKKVGAAMKAYRVAILAVLTDEQKASLKGRKKPKGDKKPKDGAKKPKKEKEPKKAA